MNDTSPPNCAIIGGGASAVLLAWHLARHDGSVCTIIDPSDRPAFGVAYATPSLSNLLNVPTSGMSADPDDPDHFLRWMRHHVDHTARPDAFVPRAIYGLYLRTLFCAARPRHERDEALACRRDGAEFRILLRSSRTIRAPRVVLACGHLGPARLPGLTADAENTGRYHPDPWDATVFDDIVATDEVALVGTGLTTVDLVLRLREGGHVGRITCFSGSGRFPARHADHPSLPAPLFEPGNTAPTALAYLRAFRAALDRGTPWRSALDSLRPNLNPLWAALPEREKRRFNRHLQRRWDLHRHRMAPQNDDALQAERRAGTLRVIAGRVTAIAAAPPGLGITARTGTNAVAIPVAHAINCTGPSLDYRRAGSPLLHAMIDAGDLVPGFGGRGLLGTTDGELIGSTGAVIPNLFALGPPRLGTLFESIAIPEIRQQARALARRLAARTPMPSVAA